MIEKKKYDVGDEPVEKLVHIDDYKKLMKRKKIKYWCEIKGIHLAKRKKK